MVNHKPESIPSWSEVLSIRTSKATPDSVAALRQVAGLCFTGGHTAFFDLEAAVVEIRLAPDGSLCLRMDAARHAPDLTALYTTSDLPGNVRFACDAHGSVLAADTQINGAAHLTRTLHWLGDGMQRALHATPPTASLPDSPTLAKNDVARELARIPWAADGVVEQDAGWELRPRIRGDAVPVQLTLAGSCVHVAREVLTLPDPAASAATAVAHQALRYNDQLRHARLAARDGRLVAEAYLHDGLVESPWLSHTAYAVAQASRYVASALRILASQTSVAETYIAVFCSTLEQPAPPGAGQ